MTKKKKRERSQRFFISVFVVFLTLYGIFVLARSIHNSYFFAQSDRVNIIFYGERPTFVSVGRVDGVNYIAFFDSDTEVYAPGGYGRYKVGSLGKLADLERSTDLVRRAFSSATSTFVSFYISPKKPIIYREGDESDDGFFIPKLQLLDVAFSRRFRSNAGLFDRLYIFVLLMNKRKSDFVTVETNYVEREGDRLVFEEKNFDKAYQGFFYEKFLREEGRFVKIRYQNPSSAEVLTRIIEGEGIRVVDLSKTKKTSKKCIITESSNKKSQTASYLVRRFGCRRKVGETEGADIIMLLGERLEEEWE